MSESKPPSIVTGFGTVKQVNSGDTIVLRGPTKGGPPDEITIVLTGIKAPLLARRTVNADKEGTEDEPFAWEAREFLRKKLIGKRVFFTYEKAKGSNTSTTPNASTTPIASTTPNVSTTPNASTTPNVSTTPKPVETPNTIQPKGPKISREYGTVYNGLDATCENVTESLVSEGLVEVRPLSRSSNEYMKKLHDLQDKAKAATKGKHGPNPEKHRRSIKWSIENLQHFKDALQLKPIKATVEHVIDGSTIRALLFLEDVQEYYYTRILISGIRCNSLPNENDPSPAEPYAEEAKYFTEVRLLQRDVEIVLESVSTSFFLGSVIHPNGNIAELLLSQGFAKCVDWSLQCVTSGADKLRAAEAAAKEKRLRIWKGENPTATVVKDKEFVGKVVEIINGDAMMVKLANGSIKKIFLASIRPPRMPEVKSQDEAKTQDISKTRSRALYDVPHMFEAREFLRKKLVGKKVNVIVDYKQPANGFFPEKVCCTVTIGGINVAEALVGKGLAFVVQYRADDDQRSAHYNDLLSAESKAKKSKKGVHSGKIEPSLRIVDLSGDLKLSKQYFPFIQKQGKMEAVVEFVASGSRLRLFLPKQNYLLTFLLGGISCAKSNRDTPNGIIYGDPYGDEALLYTKELCFQREVQIEAESMDKVGSIIGWLWVENENLSEALVREGYASVHSTASRSPYYKVLLAAEEEAQKKKLRMWENYEPVILEPKEEKKERTINYKTVNITELKNDLSDLIFYAQHFDEGPKLEELMLELRQDFSNDPPLPGAYTPKKGELCAAKYSSDSQWYRAKVVKIQGNDVQVFFVDYGNKELTSVTELAPLPLKYSTLPYCAREYALAFIKLPKDTDSLEDAREAFYQETTTQPSLLLNVEYMSSPLTYVTLVTAEKKEDIGKRLVENGFVLVNRRSEKRFLKLNSEYVCAQEIAKKNRVNLWQYGDITDDDAKEFG